MANDTKDNILNAAKQLFAKRGYDGCNVDHIADKAKVNKATIYYHFKSKALLYETVLELNLRRFLKRLRKKVHEHDSPERKLEAFVSTYASNFADDQQMAPLMLRELASDGTHLTDKTRAVLSEIIAEVDVILEEGRASGLFIDAKSFIPYFMIVGSMNIFTSTKKLRKKFQDNDNDFGFAATIDETAQELSRIILNGLKK